METFAMFQSRIRHCCPLIILYAVHYHSIDNIILVHEPWNQSQGFEDQSVHSSYICLTSYLASQNLSFLVKKNKHRTSLERFLSCY